MRVGRRAGSAPRPSRREYSNGRRRRNGAFPGALTPAPAAARIGAWLPRSRPTEADVLILTLLLLLLFVVVSGFFAAWSLWFQGYLYSEPAPVLPWRAPAAGAAVAAFVALWVVLV